jgi:hypothetical protein
MEGLPFSLTAEDLESGMTPIVMHGEKVSGNYKLTERIKTSISLTVNEAVDGKTGGEKAASAIETEKPGGQPWLKPVTIKVLPT